MIVLLLNGSTRKNGCTYLALSEVAKALNAENVETEIVQMGGGPVRDCIGCNGCVGKGQCVFGDDAVNEIIAKAKGAHGFVFGSPVYYAHPSGQIISLPDRLFYAGGNAFIHKPGAAVVTAWNMVFGPAPELVEQDREGLQTMRNLGRNMAWLLKCIHSGMQQGITPPTAETSHWTNFNR